MVLRLLCATLVLASCAEPQPVGDSENPGKSLYQNRCAQCHGMDGTAKIAGSADLSISTLNEEALKKIINEGKNAMPPFKLFIESDSLMQQTVDYVMSLRTK